MEKDSVSNNGTKLTDAAAKVLSDLDAEFSLSKKEIASQAILQMAPVWRAAGEITIAVQKSDTRKAA